MNPRGKVTEICSFSRYEELLFQSGFHSADKLSDDYFVVNYKTNVGSEEEWRPPRNLAMKISAAIAAYARIHMYQFISRGDCYYTDTDSVVLGSPLPDEWVSSSELGKFKLEHKVRTGIFLAPKSYILETEENKEIIKYKGPARDLVTAEWFKLQLADLSRTEEIPHSENFRIDWNSFQILKKDTMIKLALPRSKKRAYVYDEQGSWVDTKPVDIIDMGSPAATADLKEKLFDESKMDHAAQMASREGEISAREREMIARITAREKLLEDRERRVAAEKENLEKTARLAAEKAKFLEEKERLAAERQGANIWLRLQSFLIPKAEIVHPSESEKAEKEEASEISGMSSPSPELGSSSSGKDKEIRRVSSRRLLCLLLAVQGRIKRIPYWEWSLVPLQGREKTVEYAASSEDQTTAVQSESSLVYAMLAAAPVSPVSSVVLIILAMPFTPSRSFSLHSYKI
ncbi:hypothetical protein ZIOFF_075477 [Zingiber officinale]|uniref:DNA-directed DNA polymerase n=1 Tax=Zingiber officinale TaxID=94328 RepID=A0A8J5EMS2_ZINOF|nr:hypothetical protein ZIOFF_075477 [Zingiber officinale]